MPLGSKDSKQILFFKPHRLPQSCSKAYKWCSLWAGETVYQNQKRMALVLSLLLPLSFSLFVGGQGEEHVRLRKKAENHPWPLFLSISISSPQTTMIKTMGVYWPHPIGSGQGRVLPSREELAQTRCWSALEQLSTKGQWWVTGWLIEPACQLAIDSLGECNGHWKDLLCLFARLKEEKG